MAWKKLTDLPTDATFVSKTNFIACVSVTERHSAFIEFFNDKPSSDCDVTRNY